MTVTYVDRQKNRIVLSPEVTCYVLPESGVICIRDIEAKILYINGDAYEVKDGARDIEVKCTSMDLDVDDQTYSIRVLCREYKDETKFDYNALGIAFNNNLVQNAMDEDILFSAIEEDSDDLKMSLCTFNRKFDSITKDFDIEAMADCVDHFPHIFQKPKQHLKQINEIRPAAVVSRIGQESISHLASHSEHWKGIKASGLVPERLLARTLEDDYAIYENVAVKSLVDQLYREMKKLSEENIDCSMQMNIDDGHTVSGEQKTYFHARDLLMKGMDDDSVAYNQLVLEDQREKITRILDRLSKCRSTPLYRTLKRQKKITGKLKKTNIFMMDKYYKYAYQLSELMLNRQEVTPYDTVQDIEGEYTLFCKILFIFALRYFQYESDIPEADVFVGEKLEDISYSYDKWHIDIREKRIDVLDVDGFEFEMGIDAPIELNCGSIEVSSTVALDHFLDVKVKDGNLVFNRVLNDKEQDNVIKALKVAWPSNKQKAWASELKTKMFATFSNTTIESRKCLFVPWKYLLPDNIEEVKQVLGQIKSILGKEDKYDMIYLLTASRPNELTHIEEVSVLNSLLSYGKASEEKGLNADRFGVIPIGLGDINSYRRYTKILLDQMLTLDHEHDVCPICHGDMTSGKGNQDNISKCHSCGFQIIKTKCSSCGKEYKFTRYSLPKTTAIDSDNPGFRIISDENAFGFKNITDAFIEDGVIHPICPHCGC